MVVLYFVEISVYDIKYSVYYTTVKVQILVKPRIQKILWSNVMNFVVRAFTNETRQLTKCKQLALVKVQNIYQLCDIFSFALYTRI